MAEMGHADPDKALAVYAQAMRREAGEDDRLRALVDGAPIGSNGSDADFESAVDQMENVQ